MNDLCAPTPERDWRFFYVLTRDRIPNPNPNRGALLALT